MAGRGGGAGAFDSVGLAAIGTVMEPTHTDTTRITPVILSGGAGSRLWPMSRPEMPKQMLALTDSQTMLQLTAQRTANNSLFAPPIIVANAQHADLIDQQLSAVGVLATSLILEPVGRNTAPAIALAAIAAGKDNTPLLVMPSDHVITNVAAFHAAIRTAMPLVNDGWLVTFGIAAQSPETGYGWIETGKEIGAGVNQVDAFIEKPTLDRAEAMLAAGRYCWNGGIFLFRADAYLAALADQQPAMLAATAQAMAMATHIGNRISPDAASFAAAPADSIDYAVMENADRVAVVPVNMGWSDVGSWDALYGLGSHDGNANCHRGDVVTLDTNNSLMVSDGIRITALGVSDLIVVASGQDVLIIPRGRSQEVKRLLNEIKAR